MTFIIKDPEENYLTVLAEGELGFWNFEPLSKILIGAAKAHKFSSREQAQETVKSLLKCVSAEYRNQYSYTILESSVIELPAVTPEVSKALASLAKPPEVAYRQKLNFYVIETDLENRRHHGLHTNTSEYVLATLPSPGDKIVYVLEGEKEEIFEVRGDDSFCQCGGRARLSLLSTTIESLFQFVRIQISSHLGRAVMLGEDDAEDAFGNEILAELWLEKLNQVCWQYAPVQIQVIPPPADDEESEKWNKSESCELLAQWQDGEWVINKE